MLVAPSPLTVIIVSDDPLVQAGLSSLLEAEAILVLAAIHSDGLGEDSNEADVLLWDADPELDVEILRDQNTPVLALIAQETHPNNLLNAGVAGLLYRTATAQQLSRGIRAVATGLSVLSPELLVSLVPDARELNETDDVFDDLTPREAEVLDLISEGLSNKQIAKRLAISVNTVKFHVNALLSKFGAKTRTELAVRAVQQGQTFL